MTQGQNMNQLHDFLQELGLNEMSEVLSDLNKDRFNILLQRLSFYGKEIFLLQNNLLNQPKKELGCLEIPPSACKESSSIHQSGWDAIFKGKMACILLAGGQGSRFGLGALKGATPITPISKKSLFQIFFEKMKVLSYQSCRDLQIVVVVSEKNVEATKNFIKEHNFFGLQEAQIHFLLQGSMPFLSETGKWLLESPGILAEGPCGNGKVLLWLAQSGLLSKLEAQGVEYLNLIPVDNPLAHPLDPSLAGLHETTGCEIALKVMQREDSAEPVGLVASLEGQIRIVEYSDLDESVKSKRDLSEGLLFPYANTGMMSFTVSFIKTHLSDFTGLPWHLAYKSACIFDPVHKTQSEKKVWKFENFIFDVFCFSKSIQMIHCVRADSFSPLKNVSGANSIDSVSSDLLKYYKKIYANLSGLPVPEKKFELAPEFFYPSESLKKQWRGRSLPSCDYIEAIPL
ncbi:MAG: hypothetical protein EBZ47_05165 [Chlamydiae bacterium]|nr:hypothetical protein [Chlamydiota bacterium]